MNSVTDQNGNVTYQSNAAACILCGVTDKEVVYPAGTAQLHRIVRCSGCRLLFADPRVHVDIEAMKKWADDPHFDPRKGDPQRYEKERLQVADYRSTRDELARLYPDRGDMMEIGSSLGFTLNFFREDGWRVSGVEPDYGRALDCARRLGIRVDATSLDNARRPSNAYDVALLLHVIEHVPDPLGTLREIHRVVKPGGHLVLETPRYDTWAHAVLGRRERSLRCDSHIYFFTRESLERLAVLAGFEVVQWRAVGRSLTVDRLAYNVGRISGRPAVQEWLGRACNRVGIGRLRLYPNFRDMQRVLLRRQP